MANFNLYTIYIILIIGSLLSLVTGPVKKNLSKIISKVFVLTVLTFIFYVYGLNITDHVFHKLIVILGAISLFFANKKQNWHYYPLIILALIGALFTINADNYLYLLLGIELTSISTFLIIALEKQLSSKRSALHYFILSSFMSGILIFCISNIYVLNGTLVLSQPLSNFTLTVLVTTFCFKLGLIPYQAWFLRAFNSSSYAGISFFSLMPKIVIVKLLLFLPMSKFLTLILCIYGCVSIIIGNVAAINQIDIRKMLAFSSVGHFGFILLCIALTRIDLTIYYVIFYSLALILILSCLQVTEEKGYEVFVLKGISYKNKLLSLFIMLGFISNAGIPPLVGFWAKFWIFEALFKANLVFIAWIAFVGTIIGIYYSLRVIGTMYFYKSTTKFKNSNLMYVSCFMFLIVNIMQFKLF